MGFPLFKFTLNNTIEGALEIKEPEGWDNGTLKLERNDEYHSLVEYYDQSLIFDDAQSNGLEGGLSYIRNIQYTQGIDAQITILIEISEDEGDNYETIFEGLIDNATTKEVDFYKLECGVKRNDFWSKFINRKSIPVDLSKSTDEDGNAITPIDSFTLPLPSQKLRVKYQSSTDELSDIFNTVFYGSADNITNNQYWQVDFPVETLNEIEQKFTLPNATNPDEPVSNLTVKYAGDYDFSSIKIYAWKETPSSKIPLKRLFGGPTYDYADFVLNINGTEYLFTHSEAFFNGVDLFDGIVSKFTYSANHAIDANAEVKIYAKLNDTVAGGGDPFIWMASTLVDISSILIIADTVSPATETESFLIKDAAESIISKLVGAEDVVNSDYITSGCGELFAIMKGLHVRGYSLADKPFAMSFDQWWNGANPIFNLGLGYERGGSPETDKIRIEQKSYFYDPTPSINLDFVNNIERSYALNYIFKAIEIGYNKWSAESESGVDDPQSKRTYRTRFASVGKDEKMLSQFIAASLAIEQTRRNRIEQGKDWRLDEDIIIIALSEGSPEWVPEFDENFDSITGLLNSDARYNIRLSAARNFQRWLDFFSGCLQIPASEEFKFASGEGNYDMTTQLSGDDCEATSASPEPTIDEKGNFDVITPLFVPIVYDFEHPMTFEEYKTIRDNRTMAIGVSRGNSDHKSCFIMNLDYKPTRGLGTFTVILGENDPL